MAKRKNPIKTKRSVKKKKIAAPKKRAVKRRSTAAKKMGKKELKAFKDLLLKEREKIGGELSHIAKEALNRSQRDASGDLSGYSFHMADVASDNYEMEFSLGRATDEQKILYVIDEALRRIIEKTYGDCLQCGKQIARNRLTALPYTALCIECQKKNEKK